MPTKLSEWLAEIADDRQCELVQTICGENTEDGFSETVKIYTHDFSYQITAKINVPTQDHSYLGCTMSIRKPRAGEDWTRGRDLPDGPCNHDTWDLIKNAIINNELVKVAKAHRTTGVAGPSDA